MNTNTDPVRALADELQQAAAGEDIPSAAAAYADCAGRLRTLAKSLAKQPAPPSAPVGVEEMAGLLEQIRDLLASLPMDCLGIDTDASGQAYPIRDEVIHGIAKALSQQPAAGEEIMVNAAHDVYTLPLQPSGLLSGPRFVVHVPGPEQPAAPGVEAVAWLRMKPDGTPDWAEDCIGSDDKFLDHELASDGYYLQPLYAAPPSAPDDVNRLVRELDVALNGPEGAAAQASLCDLVGQVQRIVRERGAPLLAPGVEAVGDWVLVPRQPTLAMANAAWRELESQGIDPEDVETPQVWDAMLAAAPQQPAAVDGRIAIEPGERLFQFDSKQEWINHASRIWRFHGVRSEDTVCVDALGRLVNIGKHFADAERDRAYPIVVYRLRADMNRNTGAAQQQGGRTDD